MKPSAIREGMGQGLSGRALLPLSGASVRERNSLLERPDRVASQLLTSNSLFSSLQEHFVVGSPGPLWWEPTPCAFFRHFIKVIEHLPWAFFFLLPRGSFLLLEQCLFLFNNTNFSLWTVCNIYGTTFPKGLLCVKCCSGKE